MRRLLAEIDSLDQQRTVYTERIIPRAEQAVEIATSEYTVSKTTFIQLTDNYRDLLAFQFQVIQIEVSLASRIAQLERTVGFISIHGPHHGAHMTTKTGISH